MTAGITPWPVGLRPQVKIIKDLENLKGAVGN